MIRNDVNMKNIILIGPVFPYKGGIAHYTSLLHKALSKNHTVEMISFKFQYPNFLYPGKSQKDFENDNFKVKDTNYIIHSLNPFNWVKIGRFIKHKKPDLVIYQWWNPFFSPCYIVINSILKLGNKSKAIALAHNILPHEKFPFEEMLTKLFFKKIDHFIVQSKEDESKLLKIKPGASFVRTVHPTYIGFINEKITKEEAKKRIGIKHNENILLFFGFIREYKGLIYLIKAMQDILKEDPNIKLLIVGEFYDDKKKYTDEIDRLGIKDSVIIKDGYLPDNEVGVYFNATDLVVLPYIKATQSGVVQIAYNYGVPVLVTKTGGLPEVVEDGKTGFVINSHSAKDIAEAVIKFIRNDSKSSFNINIENRKDIFSWEVLVSSIEKLGGK